jgi:hypothetical protein
MWVACVDSFFVRTGQTGKRGKHQFMQYKNELFDMFCVTPSVGVGLGHGLGRRRVGSEEMLESDNGGTVGLKSILKVSFLFLFPLFFSFPLCFVFLSCQRTLLDMGLED